MNGSSGAYSTGRVTEGGGLVDIPILLTNIYTDALGDIHDRQRAFAIRDRLSTAPGAQPNNVLIWTMSGQGNLTQTLTGAVGDTSATVVVLDQLVDRGPSRHRRRISSRSPGSKPPDRRRRPLRHARRSDDRGRRHLRRAERLHRGLPGRGRRPPGGRGPAARRRAQVSDQADRRVGVHAEQ